MRHPVLAGLASAAIGLASSAQAAQPVDLLIRHANVIDVRNGAMANQVANSKNHRDRSRRLRHTAHPPHRASSNTSEAM